MSSPSTSVILCFMKYQGPGIYLIRSAHEELVLSLAPTEHGQVLVLNKYTSKPEQKWEITQAEREGMRIKNMHFELVLGIEGGSTGDGAEVVGQPFLPKRKSHIFDVKTFEDEKGWLYQYIVTFCGKILDVSESKKEGCVVQWRPKPIGVNQHQLFRFTRCG